MLAGVPVIRLDDERYGLERLNLDDSTLSGSGSPSSKTPVTMGQKTPDGKSAK